MYFSKETLATNSRLGGHWNELWANRNMWNLQNDSIIAANAAKTIGTNHISYPASVSMSCYNTTGAVTCFSTDTSYAWVTHAKSLSRGTDDATFSPPASLASKVNGQLIGVGVAESGSARTWTQRFLLEGGRA